MDMDIENQAPPRLHGIRVFGSAVLRVAADSASVVVAVSRLEQKPEPAFANARAAAQAVNAYLHKAHITDFGSSRITLSQETRYSNGEQKFAGFRAGLGLTSSSVNWTRRTPC